jgi:hypothetical protein
MKHKYTCEIDPSDPQAGMGLIAVVFILTLFSALAVVIATYLVSNERMNGLAAVEKKTFYLAESGIEYAIQRSFDQDDWDWVQVVNYNGAQIDISVSRLGGDSVRIVSGAQMGPYGSEHVQYITGTSGMAGTDYSVDISGDNLDYLGYDDPSRLRFNSTDLPEMNLDSLEAIARAQGHYDRNNMTISNSSPTTDFWSNPADHSQDATVYFIEGNLTITKNNAPIGGIFVVMGDVELDVLLNFENIYGVFYMANDRRMRDITSSGLFNTRIIYGGIIGNTNIDAGYGLFGYNLLVYYDSDILSKFYTYSTNVSTGSLKKILWTQNY